MSRIPISVKFLVFIFSLCLASSLRAQPVIDYKSVFGEAEEWLQGNEHTEALSLYLQLENAGLGNANVYYKIGLCYLNIPRSEALAIPYLKLATLDLTNSYNTSDLDEKRAPYRSMYYLGVAYRLANMPDSALAVLTKLETIATGTDADLSSIQHEINSCLLAKECFASPKPIIVEAIGDWTAENIDCSNPVVDINEKRMVFSASMRFFDAVFYCRHTQKGWDNAQIINPQLLADDNFYPVGLSADGKRLLLCRKNPATLDDEIFESRWNDSVWLPAVPLNRNINSKYSENYASYSNDGKKLFFSSNRPGGFGGYDIYYAVLNDSGSWGQVQNLGSTINTAFNEYAPYVCKNNSRLFFSSDGHKNIGGFDVLYSDLGSDNSWSNPINPGYPFNSTANDMMFCPIADGQKGYKISLSADKATFIITRVTVPN
jgi:hypothetical protein